MYYKNIDHWVIYHLKDVCEMCRRSLYHFSKINVVPCGVAVDVNVVPCGVAVDVNCMTETNVWVAVLLTNCQGS